jgi:hypothetical protein
MPIVFMRIKKDWDAALAKDLNAAPQDKILPVSSKYKNAIDQHVTLIYLPFKFQENKYHISVSSGTDGWTGAFHVTAETTKPAHLVSKALKTFPSAYFDFVLCNRNSPQVNFEVVKNVKIDKKMVRVDNAVFQETLILEVKKIMRAFVLYMYSQDNAKLGTY